MDPRAPLPLPVSDVPVPSLHLPPTAGPTSTDDLAAPAVPAASAAAAVVPASAGTDNVSATTPAPLPLPDADADADSSSSSSSSPFPPSALYLPPNLTDVLFYVAANGYAADCPSFGRVGMLNRATATDDQLWSFLVNLPGRKGPLRTNTRLAHAVLHGRAERAAHLLRLGARAGDGLPGHNGSALLAAIGSGSEETALAVLQATPLTASPQRRRAGTPADALPQRRQTVASSVDAITGTTPLHTAAARGFEGLVSALLAAGSPVEATDGRGETALHKASTEAVALVLLREGAAAPWVLPYDSLLHRAARGGWTRVVEHLLRGEGKEGEGEGEGEGDDDGADGAPAAPASSADGAAAAAASATSPAVAPASLLNLRVRPSPITSYAAADVAEANPWGGATVTAEPPALSSSSSSSSPLPKYVELGETPLLTALSARFRDTSLALIRGGADVNLPGTEPTGWRRTRTPLLEAARWGEPAVVAALLARGADTGVRDAEGYSPLMEAARWGRDEAGVLLLEAGADPLAVVVAPGTEEGAGAGAGAAAAATSGSGGVGGGGGGGGGDVRGRPPSPLDSVLHCAARAAVPRTLAALLGRITSLPPSSPSPLALCDDLGSTPLSAALWSGQAAQAAALLPLSPLDTGTAEGCTLLWDACMGRCPEAALALLSRAATASPPLPSTPYPRVLPASLRLRSLSPLHIACLGVRVRTRTDPSAAAATVVPRVLSLAAGGVLRADLTRDVRAFTPDVDGALFWSVRPPLPDLVAALIAAGADVNARTLQLSELPPGIRQQQRRQRGERAAAAAAAGGPGRAAQLLWARGETESEGEDEDGDDEDDDEDDDDENEDEDGEDELGLPLRYMRGGGGILPLLGRPPSSSAAFGAYAPTHDTSAQRGSGDSGFPAKSGAGAAAATSAAAAAASSSSPSPSVAAPSPVSPLPTSSESVDEDGDNMRLGGLTPLMLALFSGDAAAANLLLDAGADVLLQSEMGFTALYFADAVPGEEGEALRARLTALGARRGRRKTPVPARY
jgi:ankyrin repeat protein